jgi:hypothetical protein
MNEVKIFEVALTMLTLFGCAFAPKSQNMIYSGKVAGKFNKALINEVCVVSVTRGRQLNADEASETSIESFETALKASMQAHELFSDLGIKIEGGTVSLLSNHPGSAMRWSVVGYKK